MTRDEIRTKWIAALRSGDYEQGTGCLKTPDGQWCCLGVLCDVMGRTFSESATYPDYPIWDKIGICNSAITLAELNDQGATFPMIADLLETGKYWDE